MKGPEKMISDDLGKVLHDKVTREKSLSDEEQAQLESWYEFQDSVEIDILGITTSEETVVTLQSQIETTLTQLMTITKRIQETVSENEVLRREIISLRRQLVDSSAIQQTV